MANKEKRSVFFESGYYAKRPYFFLIVFMLLATILAFVIGGFFVE